MRVPGHIAILFVIALFLLPRPLVLGRHVAQATHSSHETLPPRGDGVLSEQAKSRVRHGRLDTLQIAGSKLPDCSHACGSCSPCRLVMVSFICATIQEAETCPMAYKCMCKSRAYPIP